MKHTSIIIGLGILVAAIVVAVRFLLERRRQKQIDATGTVVYATFLEAEPVKFFGKAQGDMVKVTLRVQEPGDVDPREVSIRTRIDSRQKFEPGMRIPVVIDPKNPKRVYPASPEAAKRAVATGSRLERRVMQSAMRSPGKKGPQMPSGYQPPPNTMRRR